MKTRLTHIHVALALLALFSTINSQLSTLHAQGTAFTYQGQLQNNGGPASGTYNLTFSLFSINSGGVPVAGPVTNNTVAVTNGLFTTLIDFGSGVFTGQSNWLEIAVSTNGANTFTTMTPRQQVTPAPYAIYAGNVSATGISGTLQPASLGGTYGNAVTFSNAGNSFAGNGTGLSGVNAAAVNGLNATNFWQTAGNAGTSPANGNFVGTTDNQPLELKVNGERALRLEPTATNGSVNLIGGSLANFVAPGAVGSVIAGGGGLGNSGGTGTNIIYASYALIGGGGNNKINAGADYSAVVSGQGCLVDVNSADSAIMGGSGNWIGANTPSSVIAGGLDNSMLISGGGLANVIGGGEVNGINDTNGLLITDAVISGGNGNQVQGSADTIGGGQGNLADNSYSTVGGGIDNVASGLSATVAGGGQGTGAGNTASGDYSFIGGGRHNTASGFVSNIAGGDGNTASLDDTFIGGGWGNSASGLDAAVGGGDQNNASGHGTVVGGGELNGAGGDFSIVAGGQNNGAAGAGDVLAGGFNNSSAGGNNSTISGGNNNNSSGSDAVIGGGQQNSVSAFYATVGGGVNNMATNNSSTVAGGTNNISGGYAGTVGGGQENSALGNWSTVGGGWLNQANGDSATVGGGYGNSAVDSATVAGGRVNAASDYITTVAGGLGNQSLVYGSTVGGGLNNIANGYLATIPGGASNLVSGSYAFAAGFQAEATNDNSFVWSDGSATTVTTITNQFVARASGGFVLFSDAAGTGVSLAPGSGSWSTMSDRNAKNGFASVDPETVLARVASLPMTTWSYKTEPGVRHVGPMAQDFHAAFRVGENDTTISTVDEGGVALAAIQGLNQKLNAKDAEIQQLKQSVAQLQALAAQLANSQRK